MYLRRDTRGYYSLMESFRDPETGKPRQRLLAYLGKTPTITLLRARRLDLDLEKLMALAHAGKIKIRAPVNEIDLRLGYDKKRNNWTATQSMSDQDAAALAFAAPTLLGLVAALKTHALEEKDPDGAEVRVQVRLEPEDEDKLPVDALRELRRSLYALSQPPLTLPLPPEQPLPRVLNAKEAVKYLKKKHSIATTVEALDEARRRGRLGCLFGSFAGGSFGPLVLSAGRGGLSAEARGTKVWGGIGYLEEDLDHYATEKGLPEKSAITLIQKRTVGRHAAGGEAQRRPKSGGA